MMNIPEEKALIKLHLDAVCLSTEFERGVSQQEKDEILLNKIVASLQNEGYGYTCHKVYEIIESLMK